MCIDVYLSYFDTVSRCECCASCIRGFVESFLLLSVLRREAPRWIKISVVFLILAMGVVSTGWFPSWLIQSIEHQYKTVKKVNPDVNWVVVLGGGVYDAAYLPAQEVLSGMSIKRLLAGVYLYRQLPHAKLILSGGGARQVNASEGMRMSELTAWLNIPTTDRILETESVNTADEAVAIKQWVHDEPFYLVTSALHMRRAIALFRHQGLNPIAAPCHYTHAWKAGHQEQLYIPNIYNIAYVHEAWHEILGLIWGKMRGII